MCGDHESSLMNEEQSEPTPAKRKISEIFEALSQDEISILDGSPLAKMRKFAPRAGSMTPTPTKTQPARASTPLAENYPLATKSLPVSHETTPLRTKYLSAATPTGYNYDPKGLSSSNKLDTRLRDTTPTSNHGVTTTYCPSSLPGLLKRMSTFDYANWHTVVQSVSRVLTPLDCALEGYICSDRGILACHTCGNRISIQITGTNESVDKAAALKYKEMLKTAHSKFCPWKQLSCDAQLYSIPKSRSKLVALLSAKYHSFDNEMIGERDDKYISECTPHIPVVPSTSWVVVAGEQQVQESFAKLAILGWSRLAVGDTDCKVVSCDMCFRRFVINSASKHHQNLMTQHMIYCPFRDSWQQIVDTLQNRGQLDSQETSVQDKLTKLKQLYFTSR